MGGPLDFPLPLLLIFVVNACSYRDDSTTMPVLSFSTDCFDPSLRLSLFGASLPLGL